MTDQPRRVRPNGLVAGSNLPPILHAMLHSREPRVGSTAGVTQPVHSRFGAVWAAVNRDTRRSIERGRGRQTFAEAVEVPSHFGYEPSYSDNETQEVHHAP